MEIVSGTHLRWRGGVEQEWDRGTKFFAEQVDLYLDTNRLDATGNVVFTTSSGHIAAESAEFDLGRNTAVFHVASGLMPLATAGPTRRGVGPDTAAYSGGRTMERAGDKEYRV